jgi:DNA transformation protein
MDSGGLEDLFEPFGRVTVRKMFGGHGVYADGLCFAIQTDGVVYIKAAPETEAVFAAAGSEPFTYLARGKPMKMAYWRLVDSAYDDPEDLKRWASLGLAAARDAAAKKAKAKAPRAVRKTPRK